MSHGSLWLFNMKMCCRMQISSLCAKLKACRQTGWTSSLLVSPNYPAAPNEDYLFDCMDLYANLNNDGTVELSGTVFYWNPVKGDSQKSIVIQNFPNIDTCIEWLENKNSALDRCVKFLDNNC